MPDYRVILVEPAFEESIGFVARAMKNFGLSSLHIVNPVGSLTATGRMRGGHAQDVLDSIVLHNSLGEALEGLSLRVGTSSQRAVSPANLLRKPVTVRELGLVLKGQAGTVGIVFGREGTGLNNNELSQCDCMANIPTAGDYPPLNLSHAAAIIFYELYNSRIGSTGERLAPDNVKRTVLEYFSRSATLAGIEEYKIGLAMRAFRNVMGRSAVRWREGSLLAGAMRQISEAFPKSRSEVSRPLIPEAT